MRTTLSPHPFRRILYLVTRPLAAVSRTIPLSAGLDDAGRTRLARDAGHAMPLSRCLMRVAQPGNAFQKAVARHAAGLWREGSHDTQRV